MAKSKDDGKHKSSKVDRKEVTPSGLPRIPRRLSMENSTKRSFLQ